MNRISDNDIDLTIAIPVYNVEKYLRRCLDSLVTQDYKKKEILIINDGSTDHSLDIIKEYSHKYHCIRYINQENKGLAYVRNRCIEEARGKYISFIDSDDFVLPSLYSNLMDYILSKNIDIMCFGVVDCYESRNFNVKKFEKINSNSENISIFSKQEALDEFLLPNNIDVITCNKIIKLELYKEIKYPIGKLYEDMFTNYKLFKNASLIASTNYKYYVYCHRKTSIGGLKFNSKTLDLYKAVTEVYEYTKQYGLQPAVHLNSGYVKWLIVVLNIMIRSYHTDLTYRCLVKKFIKKNLKEILFDPYVNSVNKFQILLIAYSYPIYKRLYLYFYKKFR